MTQRQETWTSSTRAIAARVKELRTKRGWSAAALADQCAELGATTLNRSVIANIESGRRTYVTTDELLVLAYALDVAPVHLMVPTDVDETTEHRYQLAPDRFLPIPAARQWIRGAYCPPGRDPRTYHSEVPRDEWEPPTPDADTIRETGDAVARHRQRVADMTPKTTTSRRAPGKKPLQGKGKR